jgi:hypothetical protein
MRSKLQIGAICNKLGIFLWCNDEGSDPDKSNRTRVPTPLLNEKLQAQILERCWPPRSEVHQKRFIGDTEKRVNFHGEKRVYENSMHTNGVRQLNQ